MSSSWPNWTGQAAAVVACGPSAKKADVSLLKGRVRVVAIKKSVELVPWADVVYGCDAPWWRSVSGLPSFGGQKYSYDDGVVGQNGIKKIHIDDKHCDDLLFGEVGRVGAGGSSGFQALNFVAQFGSSKVLLIGFDAQGGPGREHWYGRNDACGMGNPTEQNYRRWVRAFDRSSGTLRSRGVDVVNASPESCVRCFRKANVAETLEGWGL